MKQTYFKIDYITNIVSISITANKLNKNVTVYIRVKVYKNNPLIDPKAQPMELIFQSFTTNC